MNRTHSRASLFLTFLIYSALLAAGLNFASRAEAVLLRTGTGNTSAPTGAGNDPGFANVGRSFDSHGSVVYIGNRWALTASHVDVGSLINLNGSNYNVVPGSTHLFGSADLELFRIDGDPGLPSLQIASLAPNFVNPVVLIGYGLNKVDTQLYWSVSGSTWTATSPGSANRSGYSFASGSQALRWGENMVDGPAEINVVDDGTTYFRTYFNDPAWSGGSALANEAQVVLRDSGGAAFQKVGGQWFLTGIIAGQAGFSNQPSTTAVFGNASYMVQLSTYRTQILAAIPEPNSLTLAVFAGMAFWSSCRRRKSAC